MDPISQAAVGAATAMAVASKHPKNVTAANQQQTSSLGRAAIIGVLSGMAPDLDILIRSSTDPLLTLEFHRQFTHAFLFIPLGALLCALTFYPFVKRRWNIRFTTLYLWCLFGVGSHGLLDACTSYGTQLLWPFSDLRVAWNIISVVDPLFTVPLCICLIVAATKHSKTLLYCGLLWAGLYLSTGWVQHNRAESMGWSLADTRNHSPAHLSAKPSLGNLAVWKLIYEYDGYYYVDAAKPGLSEARIWHGSTIKKLDVDAQFSWLTPDAQQAKDIERFRHFSSGYLGTNPGTPNRIIDIRYSLLPHETTGLWGIELDEHAGTDAHVSYIVDRTGRGDSLKTLLSMIFD